MSGLSKKERLDALISHYSNGVDADFARKIGITPQGLSSWKSRNTFDVELLYAKCEHASPAWLLTGRGDMLLTQAVDPQATHRGADKKEIERLKKLLDEKEKELTKYKKQVDDLKKKPYQVSGATSAAAEPPLQYGNSNKEESPLLQALIDQLAEKDRQITEQNKHIEMMLIERANAVSVERESKRKSKTSGNPSHPASI